MRLSVGRRIGGTWIGVSFRPRSRSATRTIYTHPGCPIHHQRSDTAEACARRIQDAV